MKISAFLVSTGLLAIYANAEWKQTTCPTIGIYGVGVNKSSVFVGTAVTGLEGYGVYRSTDAGAAWAEANNGLGSKPFVQAFLFTSTRVFAGTKGAGIYASSDNGATWTLAGAAGKNITGFDQRVDKLFAATKGDGVYTSVDGGATWTAAGNAGMALDKQILSLALDGTDLYAGFDGGGVYKSSDDGATWKEMNKGIGASNMFIRGLVVNSHGIFASADHQLVLKSTDKGENWTAAATGIKSKVNTITGGGSALLAGTDLGVFYSGDYGASWTAVNTGIPENVLVSAFAVGGGKIFAATATGVWTRPLAEILDGSSVSIVPRRDFAGHSTPSAHANTLMFDIAGRLVNRVSAKPSDFPGLMKSRVGKSYLIQVNRP